MAASTFAETPHDTRSAFRTTVAEVAARAKAILPEAVNGRLESAVRLVLAGEVFFCANGTVEVGSASDPTLTHRLAGHACDCQDFTYGQAPDGWCQHKIAAGIQKRVQELLPQSTAVETEAAPSPPMPALPEAPASVNVRLQIDGREVQWTLRDTDEERLAARLEALLARYPAPQAPAQASGQESQLSPQQHNAAAMHRPVTDFCPMHSVAMQLNTKDGRTWYSHRKPEGGWCKGR